MKARDHEKGLTLERLRALFSYNESSGIFTRKITVCNSAKAGSIAGSLSKDDSYVRILIDGKKYLAHRLAWFYVHGEWPENMLDHKDTNRSNNAIENLRTADNVKNQRNASVMKNNFLGIKCVRLHETGRYQARIFYEGKFRSLGLHDTPEAASQAYAEESKKCFGEFARTA